MIALEPLNRYETHMINTLDQARALCGTVGSRHLGIAADIPHEHRGSGSAEGPARRGGVAPARPAERQQPAGTGRRHLDWTATLQAIWAAGYQGELAYECRLSGDVDEVLPASARRIRQAAWA